MAITTENIKKKPHDREISDTLITKPVITADELLEENQKIKLLVRRICKLSESTSKTSETSSEIPNQQDLYLYRSCWFKQYSGTHERRKEEYNERITRQPLRRKKYVRKS